MQAVITTWLDTSDRPLGSPTLRYVHATPSAKAPGTIAISRTKYTTPQGARRAAKRQGFDVLPGVAQGWTAAARKLGLDNQQEQGA